MPEWLVKVFEYLPLVIVVLMLVGFAIQIAFPRRIAWGGIEHFPDVEPIKDTEQRFRNEGQI